MHYQQFTFPKKVTLSGMQDRHPEAKTFMELLIPDTANVLSSYEHYNWKDYAAITENKYGQDVLIISDVCLRGRIAEVVQTYIGTGRNFLRRECSIPVDHPQRNECRRKRAGILSELFRK